MLWTQAGRKETTSEITMKDKLKSRSSCQLPPISYIHHAGRELEPADSKRWWVVQDRQSLWVLLSKIYSPFQRKITFVAVPAVEDPERPALEIASRTWAAEGGLQLPLL